MTALAGLLGLLGWLLFGVAGLLLAALLGLLLPPLLPRLPQAWFARRYRLHPPGAGYGEPIRELLALLAHRAGLPRTPALLLQPGGLANAFTVLAAEGPVLVLTYGLLRALPPRELAGVLAHEVAHVAHHDLETLGLADVLSRLTQNFSRLGVLLLIVTLPLALLGGLIPPWPVLLLLVTAPLLGQLLQLALSRSREFDADLEAARLTGDPRGLAEALARLDPGGTSRGRLGLAVKDSNPSLLRSHPVARERIRRLLELEETPLELPDAFARLGGYTAVPRLHRRPFGYWF